jgi:hypothetical protein
MDSKTEALIKAEEDENETRIANLTSQRNELIEKLKELDQKAKALAGVKKKTTTSDIEAKKADIERKITKVISSEIVEKGNRKGQTRIVTQTNSVEDVEGTLVSVTEYEAKVGDTTVTLGGRRMTFKEFKEEFPLDEDYEEILGDWPDLNDDTIITVRKVKRTPSNSRFKTVVSIYSPVFGDKMDISIKENDAKYDAELAALEEYPVSLNNAIAHNTTKDIIMNFFAEETYQDSRDAGNFVDDAKDYLETGIKPKFDSKKISKEAYNSLFNESDGYLTQLKRKVDSGEFYLIGRDLVVFDSNIMRPDGTIDRIAGEIDLLLATDKGIMIVDIKSGENSKWMNFNKLSGANRKVYSKREEYTLQQGAYATMLEKMINAPVAGIALLPVERASDSESNQMLTATKPMSVSVYNNLEYEKDKEGNYKRNDQGELVFKTLNKKDSDFFIPLYRESVQDKLDTLFPQKAVKLIPGLTSLGENQFNVYREQLNNISDANTEANRKALADIEKNITDFLSKNPVDVPEDITMLLNTKKNTFDKAYADQVINNVILKYEADADKVKTSISNINKRLSEIEIKMDFSDIDLSPMSYFIQDQLEQDSAFRSRYETHEKYFEDKGGAPTLGQEAAITNLASTGVISANEVAEYNAEEKTRDSASSLIHEAVKRIQYLVANTEDTVEAEKLRIYQKDIISLMFNTKNNAAINKFISTLNSVKDDIDNGDLNKAISRLDIEILKLESDMSSPTLKEYTKKALQTKLSDIQKVKTAVSNISDFTNVEEELDIETEEEGVVEEINLDENTENIIKKDDVIFSKSDNFARYTVNKVNANNTISITNEAGKKTNITMEQLNKDYITSDQVLGIKAQNEEYKPTTSEDKATEESINSIDDFIKSTTEKDAGYNVGNTKTPKQIRKELIEESKNCQ